MMRPLLFLAFLLGLSACSQSVSGPAVTRVGNGGTATESGISTSTGCEGHTCGAITGDSQASFQQALYSFFGADSTTMGTVSSTAGQSTGAKFYATIDTANSVDCTNGNNSNVTVNAGSSLLGILVYDSFTQASAGQPALDPLEVIFNSAVSGSIQGTQVSVTYNDEAGNVTLTGTLQAQKFTGDVNFDGGPQGALHFSIAASAVFQCR